MLALIGTRAVDDEVEPCARKQWEVEGSGDAGEMSYSRGLLILCIFLG